MLGDIISTTLGMLTTHLEEQKLQNLLTTVNDKGKQYSMEINVKKTKSIVASKEQETPNISISMDGTAVEHV